MCLQLAPDRNRHELIHSNVCRRLHDLMLMIQSSDGE
jgi:hypothetical protein